MTGRTRFWGVAVPASCAVALYLFLRLPVASHPDTAEYLQIARAPLVSRLVSSRPALAPIVFAWFSGGDAITWFQLVSSVVCWTGLAFTLFSTLRTGWLKYPAASVVLLLGLSKELFFWNRVLLSESVSISALALTTATWIRCVCALGRDGANAWSRWLPAVGATVLWALARDTNAWVLLPLSVLTLCASCVSRRRLLYAATTVALLALFAFQARSADLGGRWERPLMNVLGQRILTSAEATRYFVDHGLPLGSRTTRYAGRWASPEFRSDLEPWLSAGARPAYMRYLASRPLRSLWEPIRHWREGLATGLYGVYSGEGQAPMGQRIYSYLVYPRGLQIPVFIAIDLLLIGALVRRRMLAGGDAGLLRFALVVAASSYAGLFVAWHGDAMEVTRHALGASLQLRIGLWLVFFYGVDRLTRHRPVHSSGIGRAS